MNANVNVEDILAEMGWTDGFRIPIANEENRALELEIQKKHKEKDNLRSAVEDVTERVTAMKKHLINVKHELNQHQNLIVVQQGQVKIEENMLKTSQLEESSLHSEIKRMKKECDEISARQWTIQTDIKHVNAKLEKLKCTVKWDQDALLAWDEEVSRGCDDMTVLEKFSKEDELKFNELELRRQNLRMELENKRHKVHNAKNDLLCMEHSLEKTTQLFRKQHAERKALVQQWEASVKILHQRDEDINRVIEEIGNLKVLAKGRLKDLEEQKTFYETQAGNNKEIEKEISVLATESSLMKERLRLIEENLKDLNGNFITIKYALDKVNADLENLRAKKKRAEKEVESKAEQREHAETKLREVEEELEKVKSKKFSAVERAQRLEQLCKQEEKSVHEIGHESKKLNDLMVQVSEQLRELKETEKEQKSVLQKIESNMNAVKKEMVKAAKELHRQKELIYNADFQHMEKEIILNRMLGLAKEDNVEKYDKKIEELEECHDRLQAKNSLLSKEVARLEEERRRLTAEMHNDSKALEFLNSKKQDNILLTEGGLKQLKVMRRRTQELQVEENVMKLRVRQAEQAVEKMGGKLFSLEKQRLELEEAMRERELEINSLKDILLVRRRILIQQTANLSGRINLAKTKVEHLKKKYDVTVGKMGTDEDGQPLSLTEIKIKSAQERFELQEVGDKLDAKIKKTEREITALENTLQVIIASNKAFRNSLQNLDEQSPEFSEKEELEKALVKELDDLRAKKRELEEVNKETNRLEEIFNGHLQREEELQTSCKEKKRHMAQLEKELKDQEDKLQRADKQLKKLMKDIRGTLIPKFQTIEEKDIELRELIDQNQSTLQQYAELVTKTIDTGPVVTRYLSEKGIELPTIKSPSQSIKYASTSSLLSSIEGEASLTSVSINSGPSLSNTSFLPSPTIVLLDANNLSMSVRQSRLGSESFDVLGRGKSSVRFSDASKFN